MRDRRPAPLCPALSLVIVAGASGFLTAHAQAPRPVRSAPALAPIDAPAQEPDNRVVRIFPLKHASANNDLLRKLAPMLSGVTLVTDERTNSVIVEADTKSFDRVMHLLASLDVPAARDDADPAQRDRQVRIVWLMSGLQQGGTVPEDMEPIVGELKKYGVTGLGLVTQTMVRGRDRFSASAYPDLDGKPVQLQIVGKFSSRDGSGDSAQMEISLSAASAPPAQREPRESLAELQTTVLTPFGHPVVLCMTPVKKMTSVFIVQVLVTR